jgi:hypothetical protein
MNQWITEFPEALNDSGDVPVFKRYKGGVDNG